MTRIKICGITRLEDALFAQESGADALGFIFYRQSKRYIEPLKAADIIKTLNPFIAKVGVFVNENAKTINDMSAQCGLTHVQLHGDESPEIASAIHRVIIKAINFSDDLLTKMDMWKKHFLMIDNGTREMPGGTGKTLSWDALKDLNISRPFILAGGLNVNNIEKALKMFNPAAVDISSGVEISQGIKDQKLIKEFIEKVRKYSK